jgi:hypothetical protein
LGWRKQLANQRIPYEPQQKKTNLIPRHITVAELDRCSALDEPLSAIRKEGKLTIKRYSVADFFRKAEWEFPVVTIWYEGGLDDKNRVYGEFNGLKALNSLLDSSVELDPPTEPTNTRRVSRALLPNR